MLANFNQEKLIFHTNIVFMTFVNPLAFSTFTKNLMRFTMETTTVSRKNLYVFVVLKTIFIEF